MGASFSAIARFKSGKPSRPGDMMCRPRHGPSFLPPVSAVESSWLHPLLQWARARERTASAAKTSALGLCILLSLVNDCILVSSLLVEIVRR